MCSAGDGAIVDVQSGGLLLTFVNHCWLKGIHHPTMLFKNDQRDPPASRHDQKVY